MLKDALLATSDTPPRLMDIAQLVAISLPAPAEKSL
jgi:hypothetical protein